MYVVFSTVVILLSSLGSAASEQARRGYLLTVPKVLQPSIQEQVCIDLHHIDFDLEVTLKLSDSLFEEYFEHVEIFRGQGRCFKIWMPSDIPGSKALLTVTGESLARADGSSPGYNFTAQQTVHIKHQGLLTFIQTDKPIYKPGQTVRFRLLSVKPDLTPKLGNVSKVYVEDAHGTRITQWQNVQSDQGLVSLEMPLSPEPVLGVWMVKADIGGHIETQDFKVDEYVLPKFEVIANMPSYVLVNALNISGEICAKYTYGKPVKGEMEAEICVQQQFNGGKRRPCTVIKRKINGCVDFVIDSTELMLASSHWSLWNAKVKVTATVTEKATGISQNVTVAKTTIERDVLKIDLKTHSLDYFKPGLPYHGKCVVTTPDGQPAPGEAIRLSTFVSDSRFRQVFTTDDNGQFTFTLPEVSDTMQDFTINAIAADYKYGYHLYYMPHKPRGYHYVKQWYSPSGSLLQIQPIEGVQPCRSSLSVSVQYTTDANTNFNFFYQVMSRGNILSSGHMHHLFKNHGQPTIPRQRALEVTEKVKPAYVAEFVFEVPVIPEMSPEAHLLVYYIRDDGETVADSVDFSVQKCVQNQVELEFSGTELLPGEGTNLRLSADPGSLCAVGVTDKSVHLLAGNNQMTLDKIFAELSRYSGEEQSGNYFGEDEYCRKQLDDERPVERQRGPRPPRAKRSSMPRHGSAYSDYYDSMQAFKGVGIVVLSDMVVETRPCYDNSMEMYFNSPIGYDYIYYEPVDYDMPGARGGFNTQSANVIQDKKEEGSSKNAVDLRNYFPESWLWELHTIGDSGKVDLRKELPHTITDWIGSSFCTNTESGLGVSDTATIRAFQPFFVSFNLPYSVIRGEKVPVSVTVFNYLSECLVVELMLKNDGGYKIQGKREGQICVCGGQAASHSFLIVPRQLGEVNITVRAESIGNEGVCGNELLMSQQLGVHDAITRPLLVEAEGREEEYTYNSYICLNSANQERQERVDMPLPADVVPDSARAYVAVIGDIMGPSLSGLDKLLKLPTGCGEQNMLKFAPNIFVMQYLTNTNQATGDVRSKAVDFMKTGYQRELTYKHLDGSYSAFGKRDPEGSTWLTAFVVKSFAQAKPFVFIDDSEMQVSINWFRKMQLENGCFPSIGKVLHKAMKGGLQKSNSSMATLTAYVLIAMLEAGIPKDDAAVENAVLCLNAQKVEDVYSIALLAYAYTLYDPFSRHRIELMDQLDELAIHEDGLVHWERPTAPKPTGGTDGWIHEPYHQAASADVELTSYALMAYIQPREQSAISSSQGIVRWLSKQRNGYGGFSSTQDTVVALQALAQFASQVYAEGVNVNVRVDSTDQRVHQRFSVTSANSLVLQQADVPLPNGLIVSSQGTGCVLIQANAKYNLYNMTSGNEPAFLLRAGVKRVKSGQDTCRRRILNICAKFNREGEKTNMAVISVKMVSGWIPVKDSVKKVEIDKMVKRVEIEPNMINFYFDELEWMYQCVEFEVEQDIDVQQTKPATIHVYDYYETDFSTITQYEIRRTCGTKEELPHLTAKEYEEATEGNSIDIGQVRVPPVFPGFDNRDTDVKQEENCPVCLSETPDDLTENICSSTHVYRGEIRTKSRMKIIFDVRPKLARQAINRFVKYRIPGHCSCSMVTHADYTSKPKILIISREMGVLGEEEGNKGSLGMGSHITIISIPSKKLLREIESNLRKTFRNSC